MRVNDVVRRVKRWTIASRVLILLGFIGVVTSVALIVCSPQMIHDFILDYVSIVDPTSPLYKAWLNADTVGIHTYRKYYFYNVTNPYDIVDGIAPNFVEVGPFVYRETTQKYDVRWFLNGTVGYKYQRLMHFEPDLSVDEQTGLRLDDVSVLLTIPNPALKGILYRVGKLPGDGFDLDKLACVLIQYFISGWVGPRGIFTQRTPHEILWGYIDPIWEAVHPVISYFNYTASTKFQAQWNGSAVVPSPYTYRSGQQCPLWNNQSACNGTSSNLTLEISGKRFGLVTLQDLNVSEPGSQIPVSRGGVWPPTWQAPLLTGGSPSPIDTSQHGTITQWSGEQSLWWWGPMIDGITGGTENAFGSSTSPDLNVTDEVPPEGIANAAACRVVRGTDGFRFPPFLPTSGVTADLFVDMLGRPLQLTETSRADYDDVPVVRLHIPNESLSDSDVNRYCFSQRFSGFINLSRPAFGPGLGSKSFFMGTCFFDSDVIRIPGDPNRAKRCRDKYWVGRNGKWDDVDDGFTGKHLTLNFTMSLASKNDPKGLTSPKLPFDTYVEERFGAPPFEGSARDALESFVDVNPLTGINLKGVADVTTSLVLGPWTVDRCGTNVTFDIHIFDIFKWKYEWLNLTISYLNQTEKMIRTVAPFFRVRRQAEATGYWVGKLKTDLRLLVALKYLLWTSFALSIACVVVAASIRLLVVPKMALGNAALYDQDPELDKLAASLGGQPTQDSVVSIAGRSM